MKTGHVRLRLLLILTLLLLMTALHTHAATQDGSLTGLVVDKAGAPLPGVLVTVTGPALQGERKAVTDTAGNYRIPLAPVGRGYQVAVSLEGFQKVIQTDIEVNVDTEARANFTLTTDTGSRYEITVVAETPMVDTKKSAISETVAYDFIEDIPNGRTYFAAMNMVPGVVATDFYNIRSHGAARFDNVFLVDGMDTTDSATGSFGMKVSFEAIQEVSMLTGGMEAEYGRATGAVSNVVTKSGGNEFHGTVPIYYTNLDLKRHQESDRTNVEEESFYEVEPGISLGGPVLRDRLWFFASYNNLTRRITGINSFDEQIKRNEVYEQHLLKLSWQVNPNNKIVAQYFATPATIDSLDSQYPVFMKSAYSVTEKDGRLGKLQWSSIFTPNLFLETRVATHSVNITTGPAHAGLGDDRFTDQNNGEENIIYGNVFEIRDEKHPRDLYSTTLNYYRSDWAGEHNFKFGAEYQDFELEEFVITPDNYVINRPPDGQGHERPDQLTRTSDLYSRNSGDILTFFAQDSWNWHEKWTFNLGLRWETQTQENDLGEQVYRLDNLIAPRAGIVWDIGGDGRSRTHFSYGRYFDAVGTFLGQQLNRRRNETWYYQGDYETGDWEETSHTTPEDNPTLIDPDLTANFKDELIAGYEVQFLIDYSAAIRLIYSWQDNMIEDIIGNEDAIRSGKETVYWYYFTNLPDARRKYRGLELQLRKRLSGNHQFYLAYTLSKAEGSMNDFMPEAMQPFGDFAELRYFNHYGVVHYDIRHLLKLNGSYHLPWGIIIGAVFNWRTGTPYYRLGRIYDYLLPGTASDAFIGFQSYYMYPVDPPGTHRLGNAWQLDLRLTKDINIGDTSLSLTLDAFNVTNNQFVLSRVWSDNESWSEADGWMEAGTFVVGLKFSF